MPSMLSDFIGDFGKENAYLYVRPRVFQCIKKYSQNISLGTEMGGILIGCYRGKHADVSSVTHPQNNDRKLKYGFHRRIDGHQEIARKKWNRSKRVLTYLGEWHTHPESVPIPSQTDLKSWKNLVRVCKRDMIFIIGGTQKIWVGYAKYRHGHIVIEQSGIKTLSGRVLPQL